MAWRASLALLACAVSLCEGATVDPARTLLTLTKEQYDSLIPVPILSPVPFTGSWTGGWTMRVAAEMAMDIINSQQLILPGYRLNSTWLDDRCDPNYALQLFLDKWASTDWVVMGGSGCSAVCALVGLATPKIRLPYIAYGCASGALNDTVTYPDLGRMSADEATLPFVFQSLAKTYGWTRIPMISNDPARFAGLAQSTYTFFQKNKNPPIDVPWLNPQNPTWDQLLVMMTALKQSLQRVLIVYGYEPFYRQVICAAYTVGMRKGMVWLSVGIHADKFWAVNDTAVQALNPKCTPDVITAYINGGIGADGLGAPLEDEMDRELECMPGWTPRKFRAKVQQNFIQGYPTGRNILPAGPYYILQGSGADGICVWAYMLRYMIIEQGYNLSQLVRPPTAIYRMMQDYIKKRLAFFGVMGRFKYVGNDLPNPYGVSQIQNGVRPDVGTVDLAGNVALEPGATLFWGDNSTNPQTLWPACPDGYRQLQSGDCEPCGPGTYEDTSLHDCIKCPAGRSSDGLAAVGPKSCARCPSGQVVSTTGSSACVQCPPGTFADPTDEQAVNCTLCPKGRHQSTPGVSECARCELGRYEAGMGAEECDICNESRSTRFLAAQSVEECVCGEGTFSRPGLGCVPCLEGLSCPGEEEPPMQNMGFWAQVLDADAREYSVFHCRTVRECPVGPVGSCPAGREGLACARCQPNHYPAGTGGCLECGSTGTAMPYIIGTIALVLAAVLAMCLFGQGAQTTSSMLTLTIILGQIAATVQSLGAFQQFQIKWIEPIGSFLKGIALLTFDFDVVRVSCAMPKDDPVSRLVIQLLAFPAALLALALAFNATKLLNRRPPKLLEKTGGDMRDTAMHFDPLINAAGMLALAAFIPLTLTSTEALRCLQNPNGSKTMAKNPSVVCWTSKDHQTLVALSIIGLLLYPCVIMAVVLRATALHDSWLATGHGIYLLRAHRFLFDRFTPVRYKFGFIYLVRNAIIAIIPTAFVGHAMLQVLMTIIIFLVSLVVQVSWWPWRTKQANYTDMTANMGLTFFLAASSFLLDVSVTDSAATLQVLLMGALAVVTLALVIGVSLAFRTKFCAKKPYAMFLCHHKAGAGVLCRYIKVVVQKASKVDVFLDSDQLEDLANIVEAVRAWTDNLVIVLTKDLLKRIWCASEIVSAHINKIPAMCIVCDDYTPMSAAERARLGELWTPEQTQTALTPYQLTLEMVVAAYGWVDGLTQVRMPRFGSLVDKAAAVASTMEACGLRKGSAAQIGAPGKAPSILVLGAVSNAESLSTCEVVALILQFDLQSETVVVRSATEATAMIRSAKYAVVLLSNNLLLDEAFASSLLAVTKGPTRQTPVEIVTVLAAGTATEMGFSFPDGDFYEKLEADGLGDLNGKEVAAAYRDMLLILALPFSPLGSMGLIEKQLNEIARRFRKIRGQTSVSSGKGSGSVATTSLDGSMNMKSMASDSSKVANSECENESRPGDDDGWLSERSL